MKKRKSSLSAEVPYKEPSQRERIRSDAQMMAETIIRKDPRVLKATEKLAKQLEADALKRLRQRPKI